MRGRVRGTGKGRVVGSSGLTVVEGTTSGVEPALTNDAGTEETDH